jgi:pimeloyl-ACP methyl ester carboxylesterase
MPFGSEETGTGTGGEAGSRTAVSAGTGGARAGAIVSRQTALRCMYALGGAGPAVVLLHGYGKTGDMWVPLAKDLVRDHRVVIPDLRGMGLAFVDKHQ